MTKAAESRRATVCRIFVWLMLLWVLAAIFLCFRGMFIRQGPADIAVIFGNALEPDGSPKPILASRLDVGVRCYRAWDCPLIFVSGSIDGPGLDESAAMRDYLVAHGVPSERIVVDDQGDNTLATAQHAVAYLQERPISRVMLVSQYYHLARARLAFESAGINRGSIYAAYPNEFQIRDLYSAWREVPAFAAYAVRLWLNPKARPVSIRPMGYFRSLFFTYSDNPT